MYTASEHSAPETAERLHPENWSIGSLLLVQEIALFQKHNLRSCGYRLVTILGHRSFDARLPSFPLYGRRVSA